MVVGVLFYACASGCTFLVDILITTFLIVPLGMLQGHSKSSLTGVLFHVQDIHCICPESCEFGVFVSTSNLLREALSALSKHLEYQYQQ